MAGGGTEFKAVEGHAVCKITPGVVRAGRDASRGRRSGRRAGAQSRSSRAAGVAGVAARVVYSIVERPGGEYVVLTGFVIAGAVDEAVLDRIQESAQWLE